ncbi:glycosyltransferase family 4 protein [Faunimonas sp. B44]|uniref:glycosyltransferase family 4 protein n=1 Tax=Faunimonas sp. B44 TaxID=3461493 RepID=UPI0040448FCE
MKIAHLTSVHTRNDIRIFLKECRSLAAAGHEVTLVVADGEGDERRDGVAIVDAGASRGRLDRAIGATRRVLKRAIAADAEIYHLHDPELLPAALALKRRGKRVIFDSHEDMPQDVLTKPYIPGPLRRPVSIGAAIVEDAICRRIDGVVAATPFIRDKFRRKGIRSININNYPLPGELGVDTGWTGKQREVCYVGGLAEIRGIVEMVKAMALVRSGARLNLGGRLAGSDVEEAVQREAGWSRVNALGQIDRAEVRAVLGRSVAGLVTFKPGPNHLDAQPNKMFEYMSAGIPVIASDFPLWREIVEGNDCGLLVDPIDPATIAEAIDRLVGDPELARRMGENGRRAVTERYNWQAEEKKLIAFYEEVMA